MPNQGKNDRVLDIPKEPVIMTMLLNQSPGGYEGLIAFQPNIGQSQYGQVRGLTAKNVQNMAEELVCRSIDHEDDTGAG